MNRFFLCGALLSAAAVTPISWAQTPVPAAALAALPSAARPGEAAPFGQPFDPLNALAPVPALSARSSLRDYRPYMDAEVGPWRQLNDTVRQVGGWKTYARLSQQPDGAEDAQPVQGTPASSPGGAEVPTQGPAQKPASGGHAGHGH